jgi:hypothetical protein
MKSCMNIVSNRVIQDYKGLQFRLMGSTVQLATETLRPYQNVCHPCSSACISCCSSRSCGQTSKCSRRPTAPSNDSLERSDDRWLSEMYPFECGCSKRLVSVKLIGLSAETHAEARALMSGKERKAYTTAVQCMLDSPSKSDPVLVPGARNRYDDFVGQHINQTLTIHGTGNFLTWVFKLTH